MMMSDGEIFRSWKGARNPKEQVHILAQLNACDPAEILQAINRQRQKVNAQDAIIEQANASKRTRVTYDEDCVEIMRTCIAEGLPWKVAKTRCEKAGHTTGVSFETTYNNMKKKAGDSGSAKSGEHAVTIKRDEPVSPAYVKRPTSGDNRGYIPEKPSLTVVRKLSEEPAREDDGKKEPLETTLSMLFGSKKDTTAENTASSLARATVNLAMKMSEDRDEDEKKSADSTKAATMTKPNGGDKKPVTSEDKKTVTSGDNKSVIGTVQNPIIDIKKPDQAVGKQAETRPDIGKSQVDRKAEQTGAGKVDKKLEPVGEKQTDNNTTPVVDDKKPDTAKTAEVKSKGVSSVQSKKDVERKQASKKGAVESGGELNGVAHTANRADTISGVSEDLASMMNKLEVTSRILMIDSEIDMLYKKIEALKLLKTGYEEALCKLT